MPANVSCDNCGTSSGTPRQAQRLNPRNLRPHLRLLCGRCQRKLGYTPITHGTGSKPRPAGADA